MSEKSNNNEEDLKLLKEVHLLVRKVLITFCGKDQNDKVLGVIPSVEYFWGVVNGLEKHVSPDYSIFEMPLNREDSKNPETVYDEIIRNKSYKTVRDPKILMDIMRSYYSLFPKWTFILSTTENNDANNNSDSKLVNTSCPPPEVKDGERNLNCVNIYLLEEKQDEDGLILGRGFRGYIPYLILEMMGGVLENVEAVRFQRTITYDVFKNRDTKKVIPLKDADINSTIKFYKCYLVNIWLKNYAVEEIKKIENYLKGPFIEKINAQYGLDFSGFVRRIIIPAHAFDGVHKTPRQVFGINGNYGVNQPKFPKKEPPSDSFRYQGRKKRP